MMMMRRWWWYGRGRLRVTRGGTFSDSCLNYRINRVNIITRSLTLSLSCREKITVNCVDKRTRTGRFSRMFGSRFVTTTECTFSFTLTQQRDTIRTIDI